ncbi:MAG TPA: sugar ABC transporter ATP-binding protein [Magnetospirillaceae bacterium]|nr:sugar ABC transporter ATP-binding protein [Magnetospirillaceae bacterium]
MGDPILEMRNITKTFPGVKALSEVSFRVAVGEIHCLVGENGAGKSTLMKVLSGVHPHGSYEGDIFLRGKLQRFRGIADSERAGIGIIYQELALVPEMTIYDNIFLGHEIRAGMTVDLNKTIHRASEMLAKVRLKIDPSVKVRDLGVGRQQLVEIAKALSRDVKILILDEPTAALNEDDCENLLEILRGLKRDGVTCIMISHKLKEVIRIADSVTILRDGRTVCTLDAAEATEPALIRHMVGRGIDDVYPKRARKEPGETVLEVRNWSAYSPGRTILKDVRFAVRRGEIVGFAGLMGSGRTELARSLFGNPDGYHLEGEVLLEGTAVRFVDPRAAIDAGVAYASEDRKRNGLILIQDVKQNITLANLRSLVNRYVVDRNEETKVAEEYRSALSIKTPSIEQKVLNLSGGNQQKVSVAKWLFVKPKVLILDEPTRGIDVGAKYEIYTLMNRLVSEGMSIIMISSELLEILGMSDRIYIVSAGRISGELPVEDADQEKIMRLATS